MSGGSDDGPRRQRDGELGSHPVVAVFAAALACGLLGLVTGIAAGGFFASVLGSEVEAWRLPVLNCACGAALGAVIGIAMHRAAVRHERAETASRRPSRKKPAAD